MLLSFLANKGLNNIAFSALLQLQDTVGCVDLLISTERIPEAALFARTYAPSQVSRVVKAWKADLESKKRGKIAAGIADPEEDSELFENWTAALQAEEQGAGAEQPELVQVDDTADLVHQMHLGEIQSRVAPHEDPTDGIPAADEPLAKTNGHINGVSPFSPPPPVIKTNGDYVAHGQQYDENEDLLA